MEESAAWLACPPFWALLQLILLASCQSAACGQGVNAALLERSLPAPQISALPFGEAKQGREMDQNTVVEI